MILEVLIDGLFLVIDFVISLLPALPLIDQTIGGFAGILELFASSSFIVSWSTLLLALFLWVQVEFFIYLMGLLNWVIRKIPTIN